MTVEVSIATSTYAYTVQQVRGLRPADVRQTLRSFATPEALRHASEESLASELSGRVVDLLQYSLRHWEGLWREAEAAIESHREKGIWPVALTDALYPPLLKLIPDPPPILYVKGSLTAVSTMNAVAVVGTRNPTKTGQRTAFEVSQYLASQGYSIVSGLALGIDTAAHEGALAAMGVTVAVFATPLDKVYPAKNRSLADYVEESGGALVSEWPIGRGTSRQAFVFRDRIQSGLSIAVIPVQTDIEGGTMHTVKYAEKQGRLLLCPRPIPEEADMSQYAGIIHLVQTGRAQEVDTGDLDSLRQILDGHKAWLLAGGNSSPEGEEYSQPRLI